MTGSAGGWRFYGRKNELHQLSDWISAKEFHTISVIGGRGVGKTELIRQAADSLPSRFPYVYLHLPEIIDKESGLERSDKLGRVCNSMAEQARRQGLSEAVPKTGVPSAVSAQMSFFETSLMKLLQNGAVVVLDEFQNAELLYLVDDVKLTIDMIRIDRDPQTTGKIVFAGSHQQKILGMFHDRGAPLYQRVDLPMRLHPLPAPSVLEMAADQGWLSRPHRLLTAYTAFGGSPQRWRQLAQMQERGTLPEPADGSDLSWRRDFVSHQLQSLLQDQSESIINTSYATLSKDARIIAELLGRHPGGVKWSNIVQLFSGTEDDPAECARRGFHVLRRHLGIAESTSPAGPQSGQRERKVRLTEPAAMFELAVLPHWQDSDGEVIDGAPGAAMNALSTMEGYSLERFTREWLEWFPQLDWVKRSVVHKLNDGRQLEIDVVGETRRPDQPKRCLALCSCKRNPDQHNAAKTQREFELYRELREKEVDEWDDENIRWLLVSPEWPADKPRNDRFKRMGFRGMAANLGLEPKPWPLPVPGGLGAVHKPAGCRTDHAKISESDDPSFDM